MQQTLLIGGSGKQSGAVHLPILLNRKDVSLAGIADIIDPAISPFTKGYTSDFRKIGAKWIALEGKIDADLKKLDIFIQVIPCDTLVISCPPVYHTAYVEWGLKKGLDVIVDKPVVCRLNQFGNIEAAKLLLSDYKSMCLNRKTSMHRTKKRNCIVSVPLMRRVTSPYTKILEGLQEVYKQTGQNLTHMVACRSDGCFRFADEFDRPGAHGYREGLGTLTMSGYHYIDFMAACLMSAPVKGKILKTSLASKITVGDVRKESQNIPYSRYLKRVNKKEKGAFIGDNAELDFSADFVLKQSEPVLPDCELSFTFIQRGSTRRVTPVYPKNLTHDEGLTNDCTMVIHQGAFQSFHCLVTQDPTIDGRLTLIRRLNPLIAAKLGQRTLSIQDYPLKYNENTLNNRIIISNLLDKFAGNNKRNIYDSLDIENQKLTVDLYASIIGASISSHPFLLNLDK